MSAPADDHSSQDGIFKTTNAYDAWTAFAAMMKADRDHPELRNNDYWNALRDTAYARFLIAFEYI